MICCVITGAGSGIGRECARLLSSPDRVLVLAGRRLEPLAETRRLCEELGAQAIPVLTDVKDPASCGSLMQVAREYAGTRKPVLVNNAGIAEFGEYGKLSWDAIEDQLRTNFMGPAALCHGLATWVLDAGGGHLVNVLSVTTTQVFPSTGPYSAAKAGLYMLGKVLAQEYRRKGLRVTQILPGAVDTPIWEGKSFVPNRADMLPAGAVAEAIAAAVLAPLDRSYDEIHLMPPKGVL